MRQMIALRLNGHSYAKRHDMFDFTASLVSDINDGECARNKNVMHSHLANNYDINNVFPVDGGTITKIVNNAYEMTDDTSIIVAKQRKR